MTLVQSTTTKYDLLMEGDGSILIGLYGKMISLMIGTHSLRSLALIPHLSTVRNQQNKAKNYQQEAR